MNRTCTFREHPGRRRRKPGRWVMLLLAGGGALLAACGAADVSRPAAPFPATPQDTPATTADGLSYRDVDSPETPAAPARLPAPLSPDPQAQSTAGSLVSTSTTILACHPAYSPCIPFVEGDAFDCSDLDAPRMGLVIWDLAEDPYLLGDGEQVVACAATGIAVAATVAAQASPGRSPDVTTEPNPVEEGVPLPRLSSASEFLAEWQDENTIPDCTAEATRADGRRCRPSAVDEVIRLFRCASAGDRNPDFERYLDSGVRWVVRTRPLTLLVGTRIAIFDSCPEGDDVTVLMTVTGLGPRGNRFAGLADEVYEVYVCVERHRRSAGGAGASPSPTVRRYEALHYAWRTPDGSYQIDIYPAHAIGDC